MISGRHFMIAGHVSMIHPFCILLFCNLTCKVGAAAAVHVRPSFATWILWSEIGLSPVLFASPRYVCFGGGFYILPIQD